MKNASILIVDDVEINREMLRATLEKQGHRVVVANNGREALERWKSGDYGILITDLHMPGMDGYELTAAIRAAETGINV